MNYANCLSSVGRRVHGRILHLDKLMESHIETSSKSLDIHWGNVDALIAIKGTRIKTAVLDCKLGIIGVPETPLRLLKKDLCKYPVLSYRRLKLVNSYLDINEYRPFVYGGMGFAPLKTNKDGNKSWICTTNFEGIAEMNEPDTMHVTFQKCSHPIEIKVSEYFIKERKRDVSHVQRFHDALHAQYEVASTVEFQDSYQQFKYGTFPEDPMHFEYFVLKETIRKTLEELEYEYTDEMLNEMVKKQMG